MRGRAKAWCKLAVAAVVVGAAIHVVDAALHAGPLAAMAREWSAADETQRTVLISRRRRLGRRGHPHVPGRPWIRPGRPIRGSAERVHGGHRRPTLDPRIQVGTPETCLRKPKAPGVSPGPIW